MVFIILINSCHSRVHTDYDEDFAAQCAELKQEDEMNKLSLLAAFLISGCAAVDNLTVSEQVNQERTNEKVKCPSGYVLHKGSMDRYYTCVDKRSLADNIF